MTEYLSTTRLINRLQAENKQLRTALIEIRGWREIGSADTPREKLTVIEEICDAALGNEA